MHSREDKPIAKQPALASKGKGQACYSKKPTQGQGASQILSPARGRQRGTTNRPKKGKNE